MIGQLCVWEGAKRVLPVPTLRPTSEDDSELLRSKGPLLVPKPTVIYLHPNKFA